MGRLDENKKKRRKKRILALVLAAAAASAVFILLQPNYKTTAPGDILFEGDTYTYNRNLTNILFLGVDYGTGYTDKSIGGHQADTLLLMSIDKSTKKAVFINVPRDLVTKIKVYDIKGDFAHTTAGPICLAHSYGSDERDGSRLTMEAVEYLFYGVPCRNYVSMNIDGISRANDLVGGVQVEVLEDFTAVAPSMKKGAVVTLNGVEAMNYVRQRSLGGMSGSNLDRMTRQVQYIRSFIHSVRQRTQEDRLFPVKLFLQMSSYVKTDASVFGLASVLQVLMDQGIAESDIRKVAGTMTREGYIVDNEALQKLVLETFYIKKTN